VSRERGFGKKRKYEEDYPINKGKDCDECKGELVRLETTTSNPFLEGKKAYYNFYWICICTNCSRQVKVLEEKLEFHLEGK